VAGTETIALLELLREDRRTHGRLAWARPGFHALVVHRLTTWQRHGRGPFVVRLLIRLLSPALSFFVRAFYGIEIALDTEIGRRFYIAHQNGMMIGAERIGDDCIVRHNVSIAGATSDGARPVIGNRVNIGTGVVILGPITIGDGTKIGPNSVVTRSVPARSLVVAPAARILTAPDAGIAAESTTESPSR